MQAEHYWRHRLSTPAAARSKLQWIYATGLAAFEEKPMIAHISIGVRDIERSKRFYDAALEPLGYQCLRAARALVGYGYGRDSIAFWVVQAERPVRGDEKSGLHFCFAAPDAAAVDAFHAAALCSGGHDNGPPGLRPIYAPDYYAAFILDPDGYRIEAYYGPGET
jgi:catechol 2,3-dioxygenase-like lactoylglutathione lyase family enzyme